MQRGGTATEFIRNLAGEGMILIMRLNNIISTKEKRRDLRNNMTEAENVLWLAIKEDRLGFRFRRQFSIGYYITDFYCPRKKLAIEIDGMVHNNQKEYDGIRDKSMNNFGIKVLRFRNEEVIYNLNKVIIEIVKTLTLD